MGKNRSGIFTVDGILTTLPPRKIQAFTAQALEMIFIVIHEIFKKLEYIIMECSILIGILPASTAAEGLEALAITSFA